jgi:translin
VQLDDLSHSFREHFSLKTAAREKALPAARRAIRSSANAIRAIHREEMQEAERLMGDAKAAVDEGLAAVSDHPDIRFAGYLQDAQKEYSEARLTMAVVTGMEVPPGPDELGVEVAPYLNGMAEAIGEARRRVLDLLRMGDSGEAERILGVMEDMYYVLVSMDYPDAVTLNLRRSTDVARSLIERTRGDLTLALVQRNLHEALDRHARSVLGEEKEG